jgi:hypothetical protein
MLGHAIDSNISRWQVDVVSSPTSDDYVLINASSFADPWMFNTGATTHMTAHFTNMADFRYVPRHWINGLIAHAVGEGTIHLFLQGKACS